MGADAIASLVITLVGVLAKIAAAKTESERMALEAEASRKIIEFTARAKELGDAAEDFLDELP